MNYRHDEFESQFEFDVDIENWSKRRRAMVELLDNQRLPKQIIPKLHKSAKKLIYKLITHGHPQCALEIHTKLEEVKNKCKTP